MRTHWSKIGLLLPCLVGACVGESGDDDWDRAEEPLTESPLKAISNVPTFASGIRLLDGYTPMLEQPTESCVVTGDTGDGAIVDVGSVSSRFELMLVSSRQELADALGIDLDLKVKYGAGSIAPSFHMLDTFTGSERSVFVLMRVSHAYTVQDLRPLTLTTEAVEASGDPGAFLPRCGTHYVGGVTYEARLLMGVRFDVADSVAAHNLAGGLGLGIGVGPVGIEASFGAKAENEVKKHGAGVTITIASDGFALTDGDAAIDATGEAVHAVLGDGIEADMVEKLQSLSATMAASLHQDQCADDPGGDKCSGVGPGYVKNGSRNAKLVRLDLRPYQNVAGAPKGKPWLELHKAMKGADEFLRAIAPLADDLETVHRTEVAPFLDASSSARARYGLTAPASPPYDLPELAKMAEQRDDLLRPGGGTAVKPVQDMLEGCFVGVMGGVFELCEGDPKSTAAYSAAKQALGGLDSGGHVLPLVYAPTKGAKSRESAAAECQSRGLRLPTRAEVERMAVAVRRADDLPVGGTLPRTVWHSGPSDHCTAFYNPPEAGTTKASLDKCAAQGKNEALSLPALCVPSSGPFGGD